MTKRARRNINAKIVATLALVSLTSGCALNVRLLEDGKAHAGSFNVASRSMEVTIDGDKYEGPLYRGAAVGFGTGFVGVRSFNTTSIMASDQFQALLTNAAGKVLRCQFQSSFGRGQGMCQTNDGRTFDLVQ